MKKTFLITAADMMIIRDGNELLDLIHEAIWDALTFHGKKPTRAMIEAAQTCILESFKEEYDIATDEYDDAFFLVPIPNPGKKV